MSNNQVKEETDESRPPRAAVSFFSRLTKGLWSFLSSIKLAVVLLIILALISIIGTILAQGESHQDNIRFFTNSIWNFFNRFGMVDAQNSESVSRYRDLAQSLGMKFYNFSHTIGLDNLYHSWYFNFLLILVSVNLIVCSLKRWPHTWQFFSRPKAVLEGEGAAGIPLKKELYFAGPLPEAAGRASEAMSGAGYRAKIIEWAGSRHLFSQKGLWGRLGVYVTHLSLLVIFLGAFIGLQYGFKGFVTIEEQSQTDTIRLRMGLGNKKLPFSVRCDDFELTYYENTNRPSDFKSTLTVLEEGQEMMTKTIEVNHPLIYRGIFFYQSSYGETGKAGKMKLLVTAVDGSKRELYSIPISGTTSLGEFGLEAAVLRFVPDFGMDENNRIFSKSNQAKNPAAMIRLTFNDGQSQTTWLFKNYPNIHALKDIDFNIRFMDYEGLQYTGLSVAYDPGVWVVWLGCTLMVLGVFIAFFVPHRRVWVKLVEDEEGSRVWVAGSTSKNRAAFEKEFEELVAKVKESLAS